MEVHATLINTENVDMSLSCWERDAWSDYSGSGKLKIEPSLSMSMLEQNNKTTSFSVSDTMVHDKSKQIREIYRCDQCHVTTTSKQMLRQHKDSVHNDRKTFRCTISNCVRAFTSANYLKNHVDIEHTDCSEACIPCPKRDCGLLYPNNYRLKRHIRQDHKQEKLYQCQICARKFASLDVRNNHTKTKHVGAPIRENLSINAVDTKCYRSELNKESENETVYAASPNGSRLESLNGQSSIDTTSEALWLTTTKDSNPPLSKQIDRILCDIFSEKYQETLHSPLSSSELAIAIVSLEEANDDRHRKQAKAAPHITSLISSVSSPLKSASTSHGRQYHPTIAAQNYPQSNTESEGHSTESQRSFLVNSSQHDEFSDISMESHLRDVFLNADNLLDNPIKLLEYTCLDNMFDDFHDIVEAECMNRRSLSNGHVIISTNSSMISGPKNHLLSLNNMHSRFLGGSQFDGIDKQMGRLNAVPSNQISTLPSYDVHRRKSINGYSSHKVIYGPYDNSSHHNSDPNTKESSLTIELPPHCVTNQMVNRSLFPQDGRIRRNFQNGYPYSLNEKLMVNNQVSFNGDSRAEFIQKRGQPAFPACLNNLPITNSVYHNPMEIEYIHESASQNNAYQNIYRRRAPTTYQARFNHQMLPSQHNSAASLAYYPSSLNGSSSYFPSVNDSRTLFVDSSIPTQQLQYQQQQQHRPHQWQPINTESQGQHYSINNSTLSTAITAETAFAVVEDDVNDNAHFSDFEDSIVKDKQSLSVPSNQILTNQILSNERSQIPNFVSYSTS